MTADERFTAWLNDEADHADIPDEHRQQFIDEMRGNFLGQTVRAGLALGALLDQVADAFGRAREGK